MSVAKINNGQWLRPDFSLNRFSNQTSFISFEEEWLGDGVEGAKTLELAN